MEKLAELYARYVPTPLQMIMLRPTTIYGEYESFDLGRCHMLPALVRKVVDRMDPIEVWGDGRQRRDLVYADDVFRACLLAMRRSEAFQAYNVGAGVEYSVTELLHRIIEQAEFGSARVECRVDRPSAPSRRDLDLTRIRSVLGFQPRTSMDEGIGRMIARCRQLHAVPERKGAK